MNVSLISTSRSIASCGSRHSRKDAARARRVDPLDALREAKGRLVAVFGEANAWPMDREDRPEGDAELVQLVWIRKGNCSNQALLDWLDPLWRWVHKKSS